MVLPAASVICELNLFFLFFFKQEFHISSRGQVEGRAEVQLPDTAGQETPYHVHAGAGERHANTH